MFALWLALLSCCAGGGGAEQASGRTSGRRRAGELLSADGARKLLTEAGAAKAWPFFEAQKDTSILSFAFSDQRGLSTPVGGDPNGGKVVSTSPFVVVFDNFLSEEESDFLRAFAHSRLSPAMVVQSGENWYHTQMQTRNNEQHWLTPQEEKHVPILRHILKRMHRASRVPDEHAEALQIGRYNVSTKYEGHLDTDPAHKVARPATMITYLNDVAGGGHTLFPVGRNCGAAWHTDPKTGEKKYGASLCCDTPEKDLPETVRVRPKKGMSVMFFSHKPDGSVDQRSTHIGCPVTEGEKWIAQRWFRFEPYNRVSFASGPGRDPRFDGAPSVIAAGSSKGTAKAAEAETNFRKVSDIDPRLFLEERFLSDSQREHLQSVASQRFGAGGPSAEVVWLTSEEVEADDVLKAVSVRARQMARFPPATPASRGLRFRRLRAGSPDSSEPLHMDSPPRDGPTAQHGPHDSVAQPATVVVHLTAPEQGGEFAFPNTLGRKRPADCDGKVPAACCSTDAVLKVPSRASDALLIYSHRVDGSLDNRSEHLVCPVSRGESVVAEFPLVFEDWKPPAKEQEAPAPAGQPVLEFEYLGAGTARIFWVPPHGGEEAPMGELGPPPGNLRSLNSFVGHVFHVRSEDGTLLEKVTAGPGAKQKYRITAAGPAGLEL